MLFGISIKTAAWSLFSLFCSRRPADRCPTSAPARWCSSVPCSRRSSLSRTRSTACSAPSSAASLMYARCHSRTDAAACSLCLRVLPCVCFRLTRACRVCVTARGAQEEEEGRRRRQPPKTDWSRWKRRAFLLRAVLSVLSHPLPPLRQYPRQYPPHTQPFVLSLLR